MMDRPQISVIIPVKDRELTIGRAIVSVSGGHTTGLELIVVDDGSSDDTVQAAKSAIAGASIKNATVLSQSNAGPGAARNAAAAHATGTYLAFLDSDDYWFPWTLKRCLAAVQEHDGAALMFLKTVDVLEGAPVPEVEDGVVSSAVYPGFLEAVDDAPTFRFGTNNAIMRRDLFEELGGFTTKTRCAEDTDLFLRASQEGPCVLITAPALAAYVVSRHDSLTSDFATVRTGLKYLLQQNRAGAYAVGRQKSRLLGRFLAKSVVYTIRAGFASGHPVPAYVVFFRYLDVLVRGRAWHWLARLPLYPILHVLKPVSFPLRWRSIDKSAGHQPSTAATTNEVIETEPHK